MLRQSLIAAAVAVATITAGAAISSAQTGTHERTVVHHVYTYEPAPYPSYYPYYGAYYYGPSPRHRARGSGIEVGPGKFVERDCGGAGHVDRGLRTPGRQPREVVAALAHQPAHAAAF